MLPRVHLSRLFLIVCLISLALPQISFAQSQASSVLYAVNAEDFPRISGLLDAYDEQGQFLRGLGKGSISLLEDGQTLQLGAIEERTAPLQVVVAINSGPALAVRDGNGVSRYDKLSVALQEWAASRPANSDDLFSLTWNGGIVASRVNPLTWRNRLELFDPQPRATTPNLASFSYALDAALDSPVPPGGKRAILLVSGHVENQDIPDVLGIKEATGDLSQVSQVLECCGPDFQVLSGDFLVMSQRVIAHN